MRKRLYAWVFDGLPQTVIEEEAFSGSKEYSKRDILEDQHDFTRHVREHALPSFRELWEANEGELPPLRSKVAYLIATGEMPEEEMLEMLDPRRSWKHVSKMIERMTDGLIEDENVARVSGRVLTELDIDRDLLSTLMQNTGLNSSILQEHGKQLNTYSWLQVLAYQILLFIFEACRVRKPDTIEIHGRSTPMKEEASAPEQAQYSDVARKLMEKMGHKVGEGLGRDGQGIQAPIMHSDKLPGDRTGLAYNLHDLALPQDAHWKSSSR
eukprot:378928-Hanusia_phi.AAC.2